MSNSNSNTDSNSNDTSSTVNSGSLDTDNLQEVDITLDDTITDSSIIPNHSSDAGSDAGSDDEEGTGDGEEGTGAAGDEVPSSFMDQLMEHFQKRGLFDFNPTDLGDGHGDGEDDDEDYSGSGSESESSGSGSDSDSDIFEMKLEIKVVNDDDEGTLKSMYEKAAEKHNEKMISGTHFDSGFDIFCPEQLMLPADSIGAKVDMGIQCAAYLGGMDAEHFRPSPYYMYPRSSISKTPLRLANSVGIIDSGYRGNLIGMFDKLLVTYQNRRYWQKENGEPAYKTTNPLVGEDNSYTIEKHQRLLQICAPNLGRIYVEVVDELDNTERGDGGFGSTGV